MKKNNVKAWSLSALQLYEQCPFKYYLERVEKRPTPPSHALERGIDIHSKAEQYLLGNISGMPRELQKFTTEFKNLKKYEAIPEEQLTLDKHWQPVPDGWSDPRTWLRAKTDARIGNFTVDFKSGRKYDKHEDQARLYSNILMQYHPEFDTVEVEFWYLDSGDTGSYEFFRSDLGDDIDHWERRVSKLFKEKHWLPMENRWCKWCPHQKECPLFE